jgi:hypothetical protein
MTISQFLSKLHAVDDILTDEINFDNLVENLKNEVDDYYTILRRLEYEEGWMNAEIKAITKKRNKIRKNKRALKKQIIDAMLFNEFQKLPGKFSKVFLKKTLKVEEKGPAGLDLWEKYPWAISRNVSYKWNKKGLIDKYKEGIDLKDIEEFAEVKNEFSAVFQAYIPKKGEE